MKLPIRSLFDERIINTSRMVSEAHYVIKVHSYSSLSKNSVDKYESGVSKRGYKWKLVLFPNGNKNKDVKEHVSLCLSMIETSSLPSGWKVHALVSFFLSDQDKENYLIIQDAVRKEWHFHGTKLECTFNQVIPLKTLNDERNGYLAERISCGRYLCVQHRISITWEKSTGQGENLLMIKGAISQKHMWKVDFSKLEKEFYDSKIFMAGNHNWHRSRPPANKDTRPPGTRVFAGFSLRIMDQLHGNNDVGNANPWFSASSELCGWAEFTSHADLRSPKTGYLVKGTCMVKAEVTVLGEVNAL
ncbi:hypothetical protein ACJRO7_034678 [Eucalyptus globulus]|uniref:MATH domain-containing protein n=1 Tax=Eucalyptus globulus TaxID=34317 RepID=A0ABD3JDF3_EUCGL